MAEASMKVLTRRNTNGYDSTSNLESGAIRTAGPLCLDLGMPVVELLAPCVGERILDLGCGDGVLTRKLVELGCQVVGVDGSPAMIAAAQALGLDARVMDGQSLPFEGEFDAVFSNAALHWMPQADVVIAGVWRSLKPGGRFVGECGGSGNTATVVQAVAHVLRQRGINADTVNPWYFPTVEEYRTKLEAQGFIVSTIALIPRPTPLPGGMIGWLETFMQSLMRRCLWLNAPRFLRRWRHGAAPRYATPRAIGRLIMCACALPPRGP